MEQGVATRKRFDSLGGRRQTRLSKPRAKTAWEAFQAPIREFAQSHGLITDHRRDLPQPRMKWKPSRRTSPITSDPLRRDVATALHEAWCYPQRVLADASAAARLRPTTSKDRNQDYYNSFLYSDSAESPLKVRVVPPKFSETSPVGDGLRGGQRRLRRRPGARAAPGGLWRGCRQSG